MAIVFLEVLNGVMLFRLFGVGEGYQDLRKSQERGVMANIRSAVTLLNGVARIIWPLLVPITTVHMKLLCDKHHFPL